MSDGKKITDFDNISNLDDADEFLVVDKSVTSGDDASIGGKTTKVNLSMLKSVMQGQKGARGDFGHKGERGQTGSTGSTGPQGATGQKGQKGAFGGKTDAELNEFIRSTVLNMKNEGLI